MYRNLKKIIISNFAKHPYRWSIGLTILTLAAIAFTPIVFSLYAPENWPSFGKDAANVGGTIGGITAPFLSAFGSILLFATIMMQLEASKKQEEKQRLDRLYQSFMHDFNSIRQDINEFTFSNEVVTHKGVRAIQLFVLSDKEYIEGKKEISDFYYNTQFCELLFIVTSTNNLIDSIIRSDLAENDKFDLHRKTQALYDGKVKGCINTLAADILSLGEPQNDNAKKLSNRTQELNSKLENSVLSIGRESNPTVIPSADINPS